MAHKFTVAEVDQLFRLAGMPGLSTAFPKAQANVNIVSNESENLTNQADSDQEAADQAYAEAMSRVNVTRAEAAQKATTAANGRRLLAKFGVK